MSKKKNAGARKAKATTPADSTAVDVKSMQFWMGVSKSLLPDETDDWRIMETATTLRLQTQLLADNWDEINRIASKSDDKIAISWSHKVDRSSTPPTVKVTGSYSEKHAMKAESDVADPNQDSLPGLQEGASHETPVSAPESDEEPARVRSDDEGSGEDRDE